MSCCNNCANILWPQRTWRRITAWGTEKAERTMVYFDLLDLDGTYIVPSASYLEGDYKLMQFTGLEDKNGKEIYEGDIMRHIPDGNAPHLPFVVSWSEILLAWSIYDEPRTWCEYLNERKYDFVVIGNIYSNPELLKNV